MSLTNDQWNIIGFIKLDELQTTSIKTVLHKLDSLCPELLTDEYCKITANQLKHEYKTLTLRNNLMEGFSQELLFRKRRGVLTDEHYVAESFISKSRKAENQNILSRKRRGWLRARLSSSPT